MHCRCTAFKGIWASWGFGGVCVRLFERRVNQFVCVFVSVCLCVYAQTQARMNVFSPQCARFSCVCVCVCVCARANVGVCVRVSPGGACLSMFVCHPNPVSTHSVMNETKIQRDGGEMCAGSARERETPRGRGRGRESLVKLGEISSGSVQLSAGDG